MLLLLVYARIHPVLPRVPLSDPNPTPHTHFSHPSDPLTHSDTPFTISSHLTPPPLSSQNVEHWMLELEGMMRISIRDVMGRAIADYTETPRPKWMQRWAGMCVLNGSQVRWLGGGGVEWG